MNQPFPPLYRLFRRAWIVILILLSVGVGLYIYLHTPQSSQIPLPANTPPPTTATSSASQLTPDEKSLIDKWIAVNHLNQYGDPQDTMYPGGTPLFDETTGERIDRYTYILLKHPSRPWSQ